MRLLEIFMVFLGLKWNEAKYFFGRFFHQDIWEYLLGLLGGMLTLIGVAVLMGIIYLLGWGVLGLFPSWLIISSFKEIHSARFIIGMFISLILIILAVIISFIILPIGRWLRRNWGDAREIVRNRHVS